MTAHTSPSGGGGGARCHTRPPSPAPRHARSRGLGGSDRATRRTGGSYRVWAAASVEWPTTRGSTPDGTRSPPPPPPPVVPLCKGLARHRPRASEGALAPVHICVGGTSGGPPGDDGPPPRDRPESGTAPLPPPQSLGGPLRHRPAGPFWGCHRRVSGLLRPPPPPTPPSHVCAVHTPKQTLPLISPSRSQRHGTRSAGGRGAQAPHKQPHGPSPLASASFGACGQPVSPRPAMTKTPPSRMARPGPLPPCSPGAQGAWGAVHGLGTAVEVPPPRRSGRLLRRGVSGARRPVPPEWRRCTPKYLPTH